MPDSTPPAVTIPDHELIRPIGRGSYGEVWLARGVLGERRAVKLVRSSGFEDPRPFEREFEGLQKFEPISRSHPGLVQILHAGRFTGGFYYVMELADDVAEPGGRSADAPADRYVPRTLRGEQQRRGRLPVAECVGLGLALTDGLGHLHAHGLVHRDLKPSNVIFVRGQPKLADIGLVASVDASMSCVGTEGYLPPEGPGKPPADLYALGKVLYELATGRDRTDFPELPTLLREDPERKALEELNEVILKACEPEARRRYQTAGEMGADLALLQRGQSLRWRKTMTRRVAIARLVGGVGVVTAGVAGGAYGWQRAQTREARRLRGLAEDLATRAQIQHAEDLFARGESALALAHLARVLRRDADHPIASERLWWALKLRRFPRPTAPPLPHPIRVASAQFSPDGRQVVTVARDHRVRFWDPRTGAERLTPIAHPARVTAVAFSPDGRWFVTVSDDGLARILDARDGGVMRELSPGGGSVRAVAVSPDGEWIAMGCADRHARLFALASGGLHRHSPLAHEHGVYALAFSADGQWLATVSERDDAVRLWNVSSGRLEHLLSVEGYPKQVAFSRDGRQLAASWQHRDTQRWRVQVWNLASHPPVATTLAHSHRIHTVAFSPDGQRLVAATADNKATVWDLASGQVQFQLAHSALVGAAQFSPDGRLLLTASADQTARLWDARSGAVASEAMRHDGRVIYAEFDPNGSRVLTASWDRAVRLWDARPASTSENENGFELARPVLFAEFSPDGREVFAGTGQAIFTVARNNRWNIGGPQLIAVRDAAAAARGRVSPLPTATGIVAAQFTAVGVRVLISHQDFTPERAMSADHEFSESARIWDPATGAPVGAELRFEHDINCAHFSRDGGKVVTGTTRGTVRVWNAHLGIPITGALNHPGGILSVRFNETATLVVSASREGTAMIWDAIAGIRLAGPLSHDPEMAFAQFDPRGERMVTISSENSARLWALDGRLVHELQHGAPVEYAEFCPDGAKLVTAAGRCAHLWDIGTGRLLVEPMAHQELVLTARFSPDGRRVLTASFDKTAQLWHAETGLKLSEPLAHADRLTAASFSPDGQRVATAGFDGSVKVWDMPPAASSSRDWLPEVAEAVGGLRVAERSSIAEPVSWNERVAVRARLALRSQGDPRASWARSLLDSDPEE